MAPSDACVKDITERYPNDPVMCENLLDQLGASLEDASFGVPRRAAAFAFGAIRRVLSIVGINACHRFTAIISSREKESGAGKRRRDCATKRIFTVRRGRRIRIGRNSSLRADGFRSSLRILGRWHQRGQNQPFSWSVFRRKECALAIATSAATDASDAFAPFLADLLPRLENVVRAHVRDENDADDQKKLRLSVSAIRLLSAIVGSVQNSFEQSGYRGVGTKRREWVCIDVVRRARSGARFLRQFCQRDHKSADENTKESANGNNSENFSQFLNR